MKRHHIDTSIDLEKITSITKDILDDSTYILGFSNNTRNLIKQRMTSMFKQNSELAKLNKPDEIVFMLMLRSITELRLPYNKQKMMSVIKNHVLKYRTHKQDIDDISLSMVKKMRI
jgi:hypothetical protein